MFKKIIWAVDGTITTERMLPVVEEVLKNNPGAHLTVAHVQEDLTVAHIPLFADDHRALDAVLQEIVDDFNDHGSPAELALNRSRGGHAAHIIADLARNAGADLIVAGSHGQGPVAGFFLGGFTIRLLQDAPCPVLVVPKPRHGPI